MALDYFELLSGGIYTDDALVTSDEQLEYFVSRGWLTGFATGITGSMLHILRYYKRRKRREYE